MQDLCLIRLNNKNRELCDLNNSNNLQLKTNNRKYLISQMTQT